MLFKLALKNIFHKPYNTLLSLVLLIFGTAMLSLMLNLNKQVESRFYKNMEGIDQVMGAKGSPLQLILSALFQIDAPPGNISYEQAKRWINHPFVLKAIPLSYGDNFQGFRIIGTDSNYIAHFDGVIVQGKSFENDFEAVLGAEVAKNTNLKISDTFQSMHGNVETGEEHQHLFKVCGILNANGTILDHLIICKLNTYWHLHEEAHDETTLQDHEEEKQITAVLFKFKNKMATIQWPRMISENSDMQLASPAIEINRLLSLLGIGVELLTMIAFGILLLSALSIFIGLYSRLNERKYELSLMRIFGGSKFLLFTLICLESLLIAILGYLLGIMLSATVLYFLSINAESQFRMSFDPFAFYNETFYLFLLIAGIGFMAALLPALKAYQMNISKTLAEKS